MPGYIIHLVEAELVFQKMKKYITCDLTDWKARFDWGNLMPDATVSKKSETHFLNFNSETEGCGIDLEQFKKRFQKELSHPGKNPEIVGYYVHLYLDQLFYKKYLMHYIEMVDKDGKQTDYFEEALKYRVKRSTIYDYDKENFRKTLHEDFTKLNSYFQNKYNVQIPHTYKHCSLGLSEGLSVQIILEKYQKYQKEESNGDLEILDKSSLEQFLQDIADDFIIKYKCRFRCVNLLKRIGVFLLHPPMTIWGKICKVGLLFILKIIFDLGITLLFGSDKIKKFKQSYSVFDQEIFDKWYFEWMKKADTNEREFGNLLERIYKDICKKYQKNKRNNFISKFIYIGVIIIIFICLILYFLWSIWENEETINGVIGNGILFIIFIIALNIISKWIDIKKYQETWSRHRKHLYLLQQEMLYFLYQLGDYDPEKAYYDSDRRKYFMKRIFEIENINIEKFLDNMENKEIKVDSNIKDMMDIFKR